MKRSIITSKQIKWIGLFLFLSISVLMGWWVVVAGGATVWKIITYDTSGIEDYQVFPSRSLIASKDPYHFDHSEMESLLSLPVEFNQTDPLPLKDLLTNTDTTAFMIIKDDAILLEEYYQGYEESTPSMAFSMSKSVLSILVGMAIEDGYIQSVNDPVTVYVPDMSNTGYDKVTIRHLLQMTSGMDYVEVEGNPYSLHTRFYYTNRLEEELLRLDLAIEPGQEFSYKTGENALLGLILSRALNGKTITEYTQEKLWTPLGMEYGGAWNIDHDNGLEKTWCCLSATAKDYAKLGRLYLEQGSWNGEQLIPLNWIQQSTQVDTKEGSIWNYQYQWWLVDIDSGDYTAMGHLGQFLYINPEENMIIVRLGKNMGDLDWEQWKTTFNFLAGTIQ